MHGKEVYSKVSGQRHKAPMTSPDILIAKHFMCSVTLMLSELLFGNSYGGLLYSNTNDN